jgi:hypothetical protein
MVGLHSSDPATPYLSAWARVQGFEIAMLEEALYEERRLIRMLGMRRTMWVVPTDMAPVLHHSSTAALIAPERRRHIRMIEEAGIANDGEEWADRSSQAVVDALAEMGEATASELVARIPELAEKITFYKKDGSVLSVAGMSTRTLFLLATQAEVVRGRPLGTWISSQYRWATMTGWLGEPLPILDQAEASEKLVLDWLLAFGPGTELDIKWWTGWPVTKVRRILESIAAVEVALEAAIGYLHPDDTDPVESAEPWVALLPGLDATTMGWKERAWYLGDLGGVLFDRSGNAGPTVWVDGRVVGGWAQRSDGEVVYELMTDVASEAEQLIAERASVLSGWLGGIRVITRFKSPHVLRLTANH